MDYFQLLTDHISHHSQMLGMHLLMWPLMFCLHISWYSPVEALPVCSLPAIFGCYLFIY